MTYTAHLWIFPIILATAAAQWEPEVMNNEFTCENLVYAYPSCLNSARCISDYFLECKCVPRILKEMFDYGGGPINGHTLCLYATFTLEVGEPRCCEFYKREIILKEPKYLLEITEDSLPKVGTRSSESASLSESASEQLSREINSLLPESSLEKLIDYGKKLFGDMSTDTKDSNSASIENNSNRPVLKRRMLSKRSKLIKALKCFPLARTDKSTGYEQIEEVDKN